MYIEKFFVFLWFKYKKIYKMPQGENYAKNFSSKIKHFRPFFARARILRELMHQDYQNSLNIFWPGYMTLVFDLEQKFHK